MRTLTCFAASILSLLSFACVSQVPLGSGDPPDGGTKNRKGSSSGGGDAASGGDGATVSTSDAGRDAGTSPVDGSTVPDSAELPVTTLISGLTDGFGIAVDDTSVYVTDMGVVGGVNGTVQSVPLGGGAANTLASDQDVPAGIAVSGTQLFWTNEGHVDIATMTYSGGAVMMVPTSGGTPSPFSSKGETPVGIGIGNGSVYWIANGLLVDDPDPGSNGLWTARLDGTGVAQVSKYPGIGAPNMGIAAGAILWGGVQGLNEAPLPSGTTIQAWPASGTMFGWDVVADGENVYWSTANAGQIMSEPLAGGPPNTLATFSSTSNTSVAVDETDVYYFAGNALQRVPIAGGTPTTLASGAHGNAIALSASTVYFVTNSAVLSVPK